MRHTTLLSGIICLLCLLAACGDSHFMTDASYRSRVERDFQQKKALMPQGDLFATEVPAQHSGTWFTGCEALESIYVPADKVDTYKDSWDSSLTDYIKAIPAD